MRKSGEIINREKLIEELMAGKVNLVGYIITPFHLLGLKTYMLGMKNNGINRINAIILIAKHKVNGYLLSANDLSIDEYCTTNIYYYDDKSGRKLTNKELINNLFLISGYNKQKYRDTLYVVNQEIPWLYFSIECILKTNYKVIDVVTDDGMSSYFGILHWMKRTAEDNKSFMAGIKYMFFRGISYLVIHISKISVLKFKIFSNKSLLDDKIVALYRNVLESSSNDIGINEKEKYILYLDQPIDGEEHKTTIALAYNVLIDFYKKGYKIYVKPHPREKERCTFGDIKVIFLSKKFSVEEIIAKTSHKPKAVIGWVSTSLITLAAFWKMDCYTLIKLLPYKKQNSIAKDFLKLIDDRRIKDVLVKKVV